MKQITYVATCLSLVGCLAAQADDSQIILQILNANGNLNWNVNDITTFVDGRAVTLNLNNPSIGQSGISVLPPDIGQLTELTELSLNYNDLASLPTELFNCRKLTKLIIRDNQLTAIPSEISRLNQLRELDVRNNALVTLPPEIGELRMLVKLHLWNNKIESLPAQIGNLVSLRELYLKGNSLASVPGSIINLKLKYLDLADNKLCGVGGQVDKWLKKFDDKYLSIQRCVGGQVKRFQ